jgi:hypothetical protein
MSFSFRGLFQRGTGSSEPGQGAHQHFAGSHPQRAIGSAPSSLSSMQASPSLQFSAGASPFQAGGSPLFKTAGHEPISAPPINSAMGMSPFSVTGATPTNAPLTVGDVIHQLPAEVVRMGALPAEQPLSLPPALLENVLRSGQAALPVFELYRVCPALFQVPISPQDPRMVALPASKLPGLIAQAREGHTGGAAPAPFSLAPPTGQQAPGMPLSQGAGANGSPFGMPQQSAVPANGSPFGMPLQPAAAAPMPASGSPFSLGGNANGSPFGMPLQQADAAPMPASGSPFQLGGNANGSPFGMPQQQADAAPMPASGSPFSLRGNANGSPFGMPQQQADAAPMPASGSPFSLGGNANGSPFGMPQQQADAAPMPASGSPFGMPQQQANGSPFGMPQQTAMPQASSGNPFAVAPQEQRPAMVPVAAAAPQTSISVLFTPQSEQRASTPSDMAAATAPGMPFGSPFVSAMQEAAPQPPAPAPQTFAPPAWAAAPAPAPSHAPATSGMVKLGLATVLSGYSVEELGFNPATLPAWIATNVPASMLHEQMSSGNIVLELGMILDGISDIGFRNTLTTVKRDFKIKLPQNEVFHALTNMPAAALAPAVAAFGASPAAAQVRMTVQPHEAQQPQGVFAAAMGSTVEMSAPTSAPAGSPLTPMFGAALNPFAQNQPTTSPAATPMFAPAQSVGDPAPFSFNPPAGFPMQGSSAAPPMQPTFVPAQAADGPQPFSYSQATPAEPTMRPTSPRAVPLFPTAQPPRASMPSTPLQPLVTAFQPFGSQPPAAAELAHAQPSASLAGAIKPFDPFASPATGPLPGKSPMEFGFSSAELLGHVPAAQQPSAAFAPAPESRPAASLFAPPAAFQPPPSFAPELEEIPSFAHAAQAPQPASRGLFSAQPVSKPLFAAPEPPAARPEPQYAPAPAPAPQGVAATTAAVKHSFLNLAPMDTQSDQLLLRALLGTEEKLTAPRVVELLAMQHGLSACVCLHGSRVISHADASKPDATEFQRQASDIARQVRGLAPLIGIEGAETFTLNAGGRLLTFCFPGETIIGVLHDDEPSTGMRDKITLIARELSRMLG